MRFSRQFGELDWAPIARRRRRTMRREGRQYVMVISNVSRTASRSANSALTRRSGIPTCRMSTEPPRASALYSLEAPPSGGDTGFCNMYLAYDTLRPNCGGASMESSAGTTPAATAPANCGAALSMRPTRRRAVGAEHPIVRTHPATGRKALFLGRRPNAYIVGLPLRRERGLLDALWAHCTKPEFTWYQQWRAGDLILWDNRCVMHRRDAFDPATRRVMHRTQIQGDRPF